MIPLEIHWSYAAGSSLSLLRMKQVIWKSIFDLFGIDGTSSQGHPS